MSKQKIRRHYFSYYKVQKNAQQIRIVVVTLDERVANIDVSL